MHRTIRFLPLLLAALWLAPPAPAGAREERLEAGEIHELKTGKHGRSWWLYVPSKYSPRRSWPLVISSHGRGGSGKGEMRPWRALADRHGFIVACPDMVTATHDRKPASNLPPSQEDDEVLLEIVETIKARFRVNPRAVMITGFSGGGNPSYHSGLRHPDVFTHICTRGGNWAPQHMPRDAKRVEAGRERLHIYVFWGERDHVLIVGDPHGTGQAYQALKALGENGYKHVKQEQVPNMGHSSRPDLAASWFAAYVEANARAFQAGDEVDELLEKAGEYIAEERYRRAVKAVVKARDLEERHELPAVTTTLHDRLVDLARKRLAEAKAQAEAGEAKEARRIARDVARDFRGLGIADEAKELAKGWKDA